MKYLKVLGWRRLIKQQLIYQYEFLIFYSHNAFSYRTERMCDHFVMIFFSRLDSCRFEQKTC
ncbi:hypothetical protein WP7S18C02_30840 [Klebsiella sp. WP7-S18-CRE-02]|nr:hypothetical protein WP7S18C02_30840 [Klebsiella sp. WP7-S18-CRE-02]